MSRTGDPKLGDFGIATLQDGTRSRTGSLTATLAYAAPEVLSGQRASVSSDVYSLGATLHALCTSTAPFLGESDDHFFAVIQRVNAEPPADLRPLGVPDAVASAIEAGMAKSPVDRPATAAAFAEVLAAALSGRVPEATPQHQQPAADATRSEQVPTTTLVSDSATAPGNPTRSTAGEGEGTIVAPTTAFEPTPSPVSAASTDQTVSFDQPASGAPPVSGRSRPFAAGVVAVLVVALIVGIVLSQFGGGNTQNADDTQPESDGSSGAPLTLVPDPLADPDPGRIVTLVGTGSPGDGVDGPVDGTTLDSPRGVVIDDTVSISETGRSRVRILSQGFLTTVAGAPAAGEVAAPAGIDTLAGGIVFADAERHQIVVVDPGGAVEVLAGNSAQSGYSGDDGPAGDATLNAPSGVAVAPDGSVYVADSFNHVVRRIDPDGVITTVAGTGEAGYSGDDGPASSAQLSSPLGIAVGDDGVVYVADTDNAAIRRIDVEGTITTIAGTGQPGYSGDGGPATAAALDGPHSVAVGPAGDLYIADTGNNAIRRVGAAG